MKKYAIFLMLLSIVAILGCSEDDEASVPQYNIKVTNTTASNVVVFLSADGGQFVSKGNIPSGQFREFNDVVLSVNYTLRASLEGETAEDYFSEQQFMNSNPDVLSLNFDITQ